jgi:undecaprenyl-diphosphatase
VLWVSAAVVVVLAVGASRVYLAAHWLTDVLAGFALGIAWCAGVLAVALAVAARRRPAPRADGGTLAFGAFPAAAGGGEEEE